MSILVTPYKLLSDPEILAENLPETPNDPHTRLQKKNLEKLVFAQKAASLHYHFEGEITRTIFSEAYNCLFENQDFHEEPIQVVRFKCSDCRGKEHLVSYDTRRAISAKIAQTAYRTFQTLSAEHKNMEKNLAQQQGKIQAEPADAKGKRTANLTARKITQIQNKINNLVTTLPLMEEIKKFEALNKREKESLQDKLRAFTPRGLMKGVRRQTDMQRLTELLINKIYFKCVLEEKIPVQEVVDHLHEPSICSETHTPDERTYEGYDWLEMIRIRAGMQDAKGCPVTQTVSLYPFKWNKEKLG